MASIIPVGDKFRAQVRRAGQPAMTKTFDSKKLAEEWARKVEVDIDSGKKVGVHGKVGLTVAEAVKRYKEEFPKLSKTSTDILGYIAESKRGIGLISLDKLTDEHIVSYIKKKNFGQMSGAMHFSYISTLLKMAKVGWKYHVADILPEARARLKILGLIGSSVERTRRPTQDEIDMLLAYQWKTKKVPMADIIRFAICTAMRQAEITRITYGMSILEAPGEEMPTTVITDRKHPKKKIGNHQEVPLVKEAVEIIKRQVKKEGDDRIFPFDPQTLSNYFTKACKELGIQDLVFHDLRHEGASRLFEAGYKIEQVALFTGHTDWKMLKRYTHLKAKDLQHLEMPTAKAIIPSKQSVTATGPIEGGVTVNAEQFAQFQQFMKMQEMMAAMKAA